MGVADQPTAQRDAMLRRVAIVLSSLPAPTASRLLSGIDPATNQVLREQIQTLSDVDPLERRRAFQAFKGSFVAEQKLHANRGSATDTLHPTNSDSSRGTVAGIQKDRVGRSIGPAETAATGETYRDSTVHAGGANQSSRLTFLGDVDDDMLVDLLHGEHPQAIALVLASIAPAQAARVVPRLDPKLQSEALNRIARLDEVSEDAVTDLEDHLRAKVQQATSGSILSGRITSGGKQALEAILAAMPSSTVNQSVESTSTTRPSTHERFGTAKSDSKHREFKGPSTATREQPNDRGTGSDHSIARERAVDEIMKPRIARETLDDGDYAAGVAAATRRPTPAAQNQSLNESPFSSTDAIQQHLISLSPQELCRALGQVDTRPALLTLWGLPNHVAENVLSIMPRTHAKEVRKRLGSLGTLQLREIDDAKELVALKSIGWDPAAASNRAIDSESGESRAMPVAA